MQTETHSGVAPLIDKGVRQKNFTDVEHRVISCHLGELTSRHMEAFFQSFKDVPLSALTAMYDAEDDVVILNRDHSAYEMFKELTLLYLKATEPKRQLFRNGADCLAVTELCDLLDSVIEQRFIRRQILIIENQEENALNRDVISALVKKYGNYLGVPYWLDKI